MILSIDFDKTFTADPELWRTVVAVAKSRGHTVLMISQRCEQFRDEVERAVGGPDVFERIIFASGFSKEDAAQIAGYHVDVWIDDNQFSVGNALTYRGCA